MGERVHRSGNRDARFLVAVATQVLHGRQQPGLHNLQGAQLHLVSPAGTNRTRSPAASKLGCARFASNITVIVRPINCHPPGLSTGYTPVCKPAMPTEPAGTFSRGTRCRGAAIDGSTRPM